MTTGMVGGGFYDAHSATQMAATNHVLPWLDATIGTMSLSQPPTTLGVADFGCSEGRNSIAAAARMVDGLRRRTGRPIQTYHSDLPTNDYSHLFTGLRPDGRSVFSAPDVYSAAVGGSMFDQLLPERSLHLATTFNAIGFLSRRPVERLPGYILPNGGSARSGRGKVSETDRAVFAEQAQRDMVAFYKARTAELVPGGVLLVQVFGSGDVNRTCDGIYDALNDALLSVLSDGVIDQASYDAYYQPVYFRTLPELVAAVDGPNAPLGTTLRLLRAETYEVAVPFVDAFRATGDVAAYARAYVAFFRAFTEAPLRHAFADHPDLDRLVHDVFSRAEVLVSNDPDLYEFHYVAIAALLERAG